MVLRHVKIKNKKQKKVNVQVSVTDSQALNRHLILTNDD